MCGRYTISHSTEEILERFQLLAERIDIEPNYNVAPSHMVPVVVAESSDSPDEPGTYRYLQICKWGFIPFYVKDLKQAKPLINARAEGLKDKAAFKHALIKRRCVIPADGFYEWKKDKSKKIPMRIRLKGDKLFGFAGIYQDWTAPDGTKVRTVAIVTVAANEKVQDVHDRMPVILTLENESIWLNPNVDDIDALEHCMQPYPNDDLEIYVVSNMVNKVSVNIPELINESTPEELQINPPPTLSHATKKSTKKTAPQVIDPDAPVQLKLQLS